jgi:hypothetical protein
LASPNSFKSYTCDGDDRMDAASRNLFLNKVSIQHEAVRLPLWDRRELLANLESRLTHESHEFRDVWKGFQLQY